MPCDNGKIYRYLYNSIFSLGATYDERYNNFVKEFPIAIAKGYDIDYFPNKVESTLLMRALVFEQHQIAQLLVNNGADVNIVDASGQNALIKAAASGCSPELFAQIVSKTTDVNHADKFGLTAFGAQCKRHITTLWDPDRSIHLRRLHILLESGSDPDIDTSWNKKYDYPKAERRRDFLLYYISHFQTLKTAKAHEHVQECPIDYLDVYF